MDNESSPPREKDDHGSEDHTLGQKSPSLSMTDQRREAGDQHAGDGHVGSETEHRSTDEVAKDDRSEGPCTKKLRLGDYRIPKRKVIVDPSLQGFSDSDSDDTSGYHYHDDAHLFPRDKSAPLWGFKERSQIGAGPSIEDDGCFDPLDESDGSEHLSPFQLSYLTKYVTQVGYQSGLADNITKSSPIPPLLADTLTRKIDPEIIDMLPSKGAQVGAKEVDTTLRSIAHHTNSLLGPLIEVWSESMKEAPSVKTIRTEVEKAIILIGQLNSASLFNRRKLVLTNFFGEAKKATDVVKRNEDTFRLEEQQLFGDRFYEALHKKATGRKHLREARQELVRPYKRRNPFGRQPAATFTPTAAAAPGVPGRGRAPFRGGPPSRGRGGGRGSRGQGAQRYVPFSYYSSTDNKLRFTASAGKSSAASTNTRVGWGQFSQTCSELGENNARSVGNADSSRLPLGIERTAASTARASVATVFAHSKDAVKCGNHQTSGKRGDRTDIRHKRSVSQLHFPSPETDYKSQTFQPVRNVPPLQDGGYSFGFGYDTKGRVLYKDRPQRCVLCSVNKRPRSEVPQIPMGQSNVPISSVPVRSSISTAHVHKADETNHSYSPEDGSEIGHISGRHDSSQSRSNFVDKTNAIHSLVTPMPRVSHKLGQVDYRPDQQNRISGIRYRCGGNEGETPRGEKRAHQRTVQAPPTARDVNSPRTSSSHRKAGRGGSGCRPGAAEFSTAPNAENKRADKTRHELRGSNTSHAGMPSRDTMVGRRTGHLERELVHKAVRRHDPTHDQRCVERRLGGDLWAPDGARGVVTRRKTTTHKCVGDEGGAFCTKSVHENSGEQTHSPKNRQHHDSVQHQQERRHSLSGPSGRCQPDVGLLPFQIDHDYCGVSPREVEFGSGLPISPLSGQQQLEVEHGDISCSGQGMGTVENRSVRGPAECTITTICQLEAGSRSGSDRRVRSSMGENRELRVSPILHDQQVPGKDTTGTTSSSDRHSNMANTTVVCQTTADGNRSSDIATTNQRSAHRSTGKPTSTITNESAATSGMANLQQSLAEQGFSERALQLYTGARRKGTQSVYNSAWKKWDSWCVEQKVNPFQATVANVANFLAYAVEEGREYTTINGYRSAISAYHPEIEGHKVGQHPIIKQMMTGIFHQKPPTPKYTETWDVRTVLDYIKHKGDNDTLSDKTLTWKTAMLIALTNASRAHEIKNINPLQTQDFGEKNIFHISNLTKSKRQGKPQVTATLIEYTKDKLLDSVMCYRAYLKRTTEWRVTPEQKNQLFLSLVTPHAPVTTSTISRWLREIMTDAGVNTTLVKAHSVRGASTSIASKEGLSVGQIIEKANWSNAGTFQKFYCRTVKDSERDFQNKVFEL